MWRPGVGLSRIVILIITIIAFRLIGDAVRDSVDVRLRRR
jgi:ABC-type dipeptide/oligopeptide/nickel transport system permease subunit